MSVKANTANTDKANSMGKSKIRKPKHDTDKHNSVCACPATVTVTKSKLHIGTKH